MRFQEGEERGGVRGLIRGRDMGRTEGLVEGAIRIAQSMLAEGMSEEQVVRLTGLTPEEVTTLRQEM